VLAGFGTSPGSKVAQAGADGPYGHELSRPKRVSWLPAYGMVEDTSIPVSCGGVKMHVFMDEEVVMPFGRP
jgi:hypothetical protein